MADLAEKCSFRLILGYSGDYCHPYFKSLVHEQAVHVSEKVREGVIFLGRYENGIFDPFGTAFVVSCLTKQHWFFQYVTAEHVIDDICEDGREVIHLRINKKGGGHIIEEVNVNEWYRYPDAINPVDVAALPISANPFNYVFAHVPLHQLAATEENLPGERSVAIGDDIFVVGLFTNHFGEDRNIPIIRAGTLSAKPEEPIKTERYQYMNAYLIELHSIGGLSGSPVYVCTRLYDQLRLGVEEKKQNKLYYDYYLLGLVHGHFDVKDMNKDTAISGEDASRGEYINTGIGVVVPVERIIETINQPELVELREKVVDKKMKQDGATADSVKPKEENELYVDEILENMLELPPETHEEMKKKK